MPSTNPEEKDLSVEKLKQYIQSYAQPNNLQATKALFVSLGLVAASYFLIFLPYSLAAFAGWTLHSWTLLRIFVQFHDMAHFSFFESIFLNKFFGTIFGVIVHFPFQMWRDGHNHHHKHFGNLDRLDLSQTILFTRKQYEAFPLPKRILARLIREPVIFFFIFTPFLWFVLLLITVSKRYGIFSLPTLHKLISMAGLFYLVSFTPIPPLQLFLSYYFAIILGVVVFHMEHAVNMPYRERTANYDPNRAALEGSTYLLVPSWLKVFTCGIEYHHIHHMNTNVPSYRIGECHHAYENEKNQWKTHNIHTIEIADVWRSLQNVMLDEEAKRLIPFSYSSL